MASDSRSFLEYNNEYYRFRSPPGIWAAAEQEGFL